MPKATTCSVLLSLKGSRARNCLSCWHCTRRVWEQHLQEQQDHTLCSFTGKSHGCCYVLQALPLTHFRHTNPARPHSLTEPIIHPQPSLVLAREATACVSNNYCHTPTLICMPRNYPALCALAYICFTGRPSRSHSPETHMR